MKFCWCTLKVKNMDESLTFYKEIVGLEENQRFNAGPGMEIAFLGTGDTKVELISNQDQLDTDYGQDISLGFEVNSLEAMMEVLREKGYEIHSGPFQPNPNIRFFYVQDPNGLKVQFVENIL